MNVTTGTTQEDIKAEIEKIEEELNTSWHLTRWDREALHEELYYLYSFVVSDEI